MNALQKVQAAIKTFLSLVIPPAEPEARPKPPPAPHFKQPIPFGFTTPVGMTEPEARKLAEEVKETLERQTGKKLVIMHLVSVPCNCPNCRKRVMAPWN